MKILRFAAAALLASSLAACLPVTTKTAVGETVGFVNDPAIEGVWRGQVDQKDPTVTFFNFIGNADNTITLVGVTPKQEGQNSDWGTYALTTTTLGGHRYINARETSDDGKPTPPDKRAQNVPVLYTVAGDTLTLYLLDEDLATAAIAAHRIAGTVTKTQFSSDVAITADAAALDALLKTDAGAKLFKVFIVLHRVR